VIFTRWSSATRTGRPAVTINSIDGAALWAAALPPPIIDASIAATTALSLMIRTDAPASSMADDSEESLNVVRGARHAGSLRLHHAVDGR
jgi:hypothetical protein